MRGPLRHNLWSYSVLSLILLAANIGAPFRSSSPGRALLECLRQEVARSPEIRVRAVSSMGASHGFQAILALARGGPDDVDLGSRSLLSISFLPFSTANLPGGHAPNAVARPDPPLRC